MTNKKATPRIKAGKTYFIARYDRPNLLHFDFRMYPNMEPHYHLATIEEVLAFEPSDKTRDYYVWEVDGKPDLLFIDGAKLKEITDYLEKTLKNKMAADTLNRTYKTAANDADNAKSFARTLMTNWLEWTLDMDFANEPAGFSFQGNVVCTTHWLERKAKCIGKLDDFKQEMRPIVAEQRKREAQERIRRIRERNKRHTPK